MTDRQDLSRGVSEVIGTVLLFVIVTVAIVGLGGTGIMLTSTADTSTTEFSDQQTVSDFATALDELESSDTSRESVSLPDDLEVSSGTNISITVKTIDKHWKKTRAYANGYGRNGTIRIQTPTIAQAGEQETRLIYEAGGIFETANDQVRVLRRPIVQITNSGVQVGAPQIDGNGALKTQSSVELVQNNNATVAAKQAQLADYWTTTNGTFAPVDITFTIDSEYSRVWQTYFEQMIESASLNADTTITSVSTRNPQSISVSFDDFGRQQRTFSLTQFTKPVYYGGEVETISEFNNANITAYNTRYNTETNRLSITTEPGVAPPQPTAYTVPLLFDETKGEWIIAKCDQGGSNGNNGNGNNGNGNNGNGNNGNGNNGNGNNGNGNNGSGNNGNGNNGNGNNGNGNNGNGNNGNGNNGNGNNGNGNNGNGNNGNGNNGNANGGGNIAVGCPGPQLVWTDISGNTVYSDINGPDQISDWENQPTNVAFKTAPDTIVGIIGEPGDGYNTENTRGIVSDGHIVQIFTGSIVDGQPQNVGRTELNTELNITDVRLNKKNDTTAIAEVTIDGFAIDEQYVTLTVGDRPVDTARVDTRSEDELNNIQLMFNTDKHNPVSASEITVTTVDDTESVPIETTETEVTVAPRTASEFTIEQTQAQLAPETALTIEEIGSPTQIGTDLGITATIRNESDTSAARNTETIYITDPAADYAVIAQTTITIPETKTTATTAITEVNKRTQVGVAYRDNQQTESVLITDPVIQTTNTGKVQLTIPTVAVLGSD